MMAMGQAQDPVDPSPAQPLLAFGMSCFGVFHWDLPERELPADLPPICMFNEHWEFGAVTDAGWLDATTQSNLAISAQCKGW